MSLSDKKQGGAIGFFYGEEDVKQFIKELKEKIGVQYLSRIIEELAGKELI